MIICRPGYRAKPTFPEPITGIEQIHTIKLLRVTFSDNLSFAPHIDNTLCSVSQRFYLLKQLDIRDLNQAALDIVFHSLVFNKITYASQSFSGYLLEQHIDRLHQAILNKAKNGDLSLFSITYVISSKTKIIDFSGKYQVTLKTPPIQFSHQLEALPMSLVTAVILTRFLAVTITYIINPLLIDASLSTYESNHKTRYAVSALIM